MKVDSASLRRENRRMQPFRVDVLPSHESNTDSSVDLC